MADLNDVAKTTSKIVEHLIKHKMGVKIKVKKNKDTVIAVTDTCRFSISIKGIKFTGANNSSNKKLYEKYKGRQLKSKGKQYRADASLKAIDKAVAIILNTK